jgi:hypothetical protein
MNIEKEYNGQLNKRLTEKAMESWEILQTLTLMIKESELKNMENDFQKLVDDLANLIHKMPKS